jgi:hypothetical protein
MAKKTRKPLGSKRLLAAYNTAVTPAREADDEPVLCCGRPRRYCYCTAAEREYAYRKALSQPSSGEETGRLRAMWQAGFDACRNYGDNWIHCEGEQKERAIQRALAALNQSPSVSPDRPTKEQVEALRADADDLADDDCQTCKNIGAGYHMALDAVLALFASMSTERDETATPTAPAPTENVVDVPDVPAPRGICFKQKLDPPNAMARCMFKAGHRGPHQWER